MTERRYSDDEVAQILRSAVEQRATGAELTRSEGLTLTELKEIGAEVGLDAAGIERAARALEQRAHTPPVGSFLGQPTTVEYERVVPVKLAESALPSLLDAVRTGFARHGIVEEVFGGLEWKARSAMGGRYVSIRPEGGGTRIRVLGNYRDGLLGTIAMGGSIGGAAALVILARTGLIANPFVLIPVLVAFVLALALPWRYVFGKERAAAEEIIEELEQRLRETGASDTIETGASDG